jgi:hypothetical protein
MSSMLSTRVRPSSVKYCSVNNSSVLNNSLPIEVRSPLCSSYLLRNLPTADFYTVAVGYGNYSIAYSIDGITWYGLNNIFSTGYAISYNGNTYVAVGDGTNTLAYSNDLFHWTGLGNTIFSLGHDVKWDVFRNRFTAVGLSSNGKACVTYSVDGKVWDAITDLSNLILDVRCVTFNSQTIVIGGGYPVNGNQDIIYLDNGGVWTASTCAVLIDVTNSVFWDSDKSLFFAGSINSIFISSTGHQWTDTGRNIFAGGPIVGIYSDTNISLTAGYGDPLNIRNTLGYSYTGTQNDWIAVSSNDSFGNANGSNDNSEGQCVTKNGTYYVAGGHSEGDGIGNILYSTNGILWKKANYHNIFTTCNNILWTGRHY